MIEQSLETVVASSRYIPSEFQNILETLSFSPDDSIEICWDKFADAIRNCAFWETCGFDKDESVELLKLYNPVVLLAAQYLGMDYLYRRQDVNPYGITELEKWITPSDETSSVDEIYNLFRKILPSLYENTACMIDPAEINPYLQYKQNKAYLNKTGKAIRKSFFPEINFYVRKNLIELNKFEELEPYETMPDDPSQKKVKIKQFPFVDVGITLKGKKYLCSPSFPKLNYMIFSKAKWLPGSYYVRRGYWDLSEIVDLDDSFKVISFSKEEKDNHIDVLTKYGYENLLHLNRISFSIEKCIDYFSAHKKQKIVMQKQIAATFGILVYCPSVAIARFMLKDVECIATHLNTSDIFEVRKSLCRIISANSLIYPSIVCAFAKLLYTENGKLSEEMLRRRTSRPELPDFDTMNSESFDYEKAWCNTKYFNLEKSTKKHVTTTEYYFSTEFNISSNMENFMQSLLSHDGVRWMTDSYIFLNMRKTGIIEKLYGWEKAKTCLYDESQYLADRMKAYYGTLEQIKNNSPSQTKQSV